MTYRSREYDLGLGVNRLRLRNNMSVAEFADRLNISRMQAYRYIDAVDMKFSKVCELADEFDMSVTDFLQLCRR